ncbi:hypothetical protein [Litorivivens sp.]|uniref:hypothetical protein n=1 Tax=Litorivivens sp. TaxID=2020868 RepID=UPI00356822C9
MLINPVNEFRYKLRSWSGTPANAYGTLCTKATNAYGTWTSLISGASVAHDIYAVYININRIGGGAASDTICNIGIDPAGGTSFTTLIPDLLCSAAAVYAASFNGASGGISYYFPIFIPAGSSVGAQFSTNGAVNNPYAMLTLYGQPSRPDAINVGRWVDSYGITAASSSGTAVTPGTSSPGSWTSLGTPSRSGWYTQVGLGINDSTMAAEAYLCDLAAGDASNKRILTEHNLFATDTLEQMGNCYRDEQCYGMVTTSDTLYGRIQASATGNSNLSLAAYVLGG